MTKHVFKLHQSGIEYSRLTGEIMWSGNVWHGMGDTSDDDSEGSADGNSDTEHRAGEDPAAGDRAADLQTVVDEEVDAIQDRMAEIRDRMESVGDQLEDRWETDPDRTPGEPADPDEIVERLEKYETSDDRSRDPAADGVGEETTAEGTTDGDDS